MTNRKLRTVLTIIGIIIGPATIVSLAAATQGYSNATTSQFNKLGATTLFVSASARGFSLTDSIVAEMQVLPGVSTALPYQQLSGTISQGGGSTVAVQIIATNLVNLTKVFPSLSVYEGSYPSSTDLAGAIIGHSIAFPDITGASNVTVNQVLTVTGVGRGITFGPSFASFSSSGSGASTSKSFIVRGILNSYGEGFLINPDDDAFVPLAEGEQLLHSYDYTGVLVVASSNSAVSTVETELTTEFGNDIRVTSVSSILSTVTSVTQSTGTLLEAVGGISVLVAFIAIMTTEFTSVMERTKEIGILKALGASARTIMVNFISEALVTGFLGGVIGAGIGSALSFVVIGLLAGEKGISLGSPAGTSTGPRGSSGRGTFVGGGGGGVAFAASPAASPASSSSTVSITPALTPELILLAILLATVVGGLAGVLPAWRASRLTPVEALHTE